MHVEVAADYASEYPYIQVDEHQIAVYTVQLLILVEKWHGSPDFSGMGGSA